MNYHIEDTAELEKRLTLNIPAETVNDALDAAVAKKKKNLVLDGFRKGLVPSDVIETQFRKELAVQATEDLLRTTVEDILKKESLVPVSGLQFNGQEMQCVRRDQAFSISCMFEVLPTISLPDLAELSIEVEEIMPKPEAVRQTARLLTRRFAKLENLGEEDSPVDGDIALINMVASSDGRLFIGGNAEKRYLELGNGSNIQEVEAVIRSLKIGQEGQSIFLCPQDYIDPSLRGKPVTFRIKLLNAFREKFPKVTDELAHSMGQPSASALRKYFYDYEFNRELKELKERSRQKLLQNILETVDFPLPKSMVNKAVNAYLTKTGEILTVAGLSSKEKEDILRQVREEAEIHACRRVKAQCFLMAIGNKAHLQVYEKDADMLIRQMAEESGQEYEKLRDQIWKSEAINDIQEQLLADKALDYMYDKARKIVIDANGIPLTPPVCDSLS